MNQFNPVEPLNLGENNDPKLVIKIMNSYFKEMAEAIQNEGGLVLQFIGDEIYAVFGVTYISARPFSQGFPCRAGNEATLS